MIRCILSRGSRTASLLKAGNRNYSTTTHAEEKPPTPKPLPPFSSIFGDNASHTTIEDELELEKFDSTLRASFGQAGDVPGHSSYEYPADYAKAPDLPLSPFMNPEYKAAKQKGREPKAPSSKTPTHFQSQLAKNPYAMALATPVRFCPLSRTQLPSFFLQDFRFMAHPETKEPWWVPGNLTTEYSKLGRHSGGDLLSADKFHTYEPTQESSLEAPESKTFEPLGGPDLLAPEFAGFQARQDIQNPTEGGANTESAECLDHQTDTNTKPTTAVIISKHNLETMGAKVWLASRQELLAALQDPSTGYGTEPWKRMSVPMMARKATAKTIEKSNWRRDMDTFVLELMRRRAREAIENLYALKRGYIAGCKNWKQASSPKRQAAVILWTGHSTKGKFVEEGEEQIHGPPEFATFDIEPSSSTKTGARRRTKIPVHNLQMLLGQDHLEALRERIHNFKQELLIIREKRRALDVVLKLWKLQGYLARYEEFFSMEEAHEIMNSLKVRRLPRDQSNAESAKGVGKGHALTGRKLKKTGLIRDKVWTPKRGEIAQESFDESKGEERRRYIGARKESEELDLYEDSKRRRRSLYERQLQKPELFDE